MEFEFENFIAKCEYNHVSFTSLTLYFNKNNSGLNK